jgi:hypothetical protein
MYKFVNKFVDLFELLQTLRRRRAKGVMRSLELLFGGSA